MVQYTEAIPLGTLMRMGVEALLVALLKGSLAPFKVGVKELLAVRGSVLNLLKTKHALTLDFLLNACVGRLSGLIHLAMLNPFVSVT